MDTSERVQTIYDILCLRAEHSLRQAIVDKLKIHDDLLTTDISRFNILSEIEYLINFTPIVFTDESRNIKTSRYLLCGGHFGKKPVTLVTTDMTHRDILLQPAGRMTIPHEDIKPFHRLYQSICILKKIAKHQDIVSILAYQINPFPFFFVFEGSCQMSLADELQKETEKTQNYASKHALISMVEQAVSAIVHCHNNSIILRNINTSKFFLSASGKEIKLADFSDAIELTIKAKQHSEGKMTICRLFLLL